MRPCRYKEHEKRSVLLSQISGIEKTPGHKKTIIAIARKMLVAIYHMIQDDADFFPVDHEETVTRNTQTDKGLNLTNIIAFLGEHGADAETLRLIEAQCSEGCEKDADETGMTESFEKEKQPVSDTVHQDAPGHGSARKKNPSKSCQTEQNDSFGVPVPTAATA